MWQSVAPFRIFALVLCSSFRLIPSWGCSFWNVSSAIAQRLMLIPIFVVLNLKYASHPQIWEELNVMLKSPRLLSWQLMRNDAPGREEGPGICSSGTSAISCSSSDSEDTSLESSSSSSSTTISGATFLQRRVKLNQNAVSNHGMTMSLTLQAWTCPVLAELYQDSPPLPSWQAAEPSHNHERNWSCTYFDTFLVESFANALKF